MWVYIYLGAQNNTLLMLIDWANTKTRQLLWGSLTALPASEGLNGRTYKPRNGSKGCSSTISHHEGFTCERDCNHCAWAENHWAVPVVAMWMRAIVLKHIYIKPPRKVRSLLTLANTHQLQIYSCLLHFLFCYHTVCCFNQFWSLPLWTRVSSSR